MIFPVLVLLFVIFISGIRIAREYERAVVFRLGRYAGLRGPGLFWLIPLGIENQTRGGLRIVTNPVHGELLSEAEIKCLAVL